MDNLIDFPVSDTFARGLEEMHDMPEGSLEHRIDWRHRSEAYRREIIERQTKEARRRNETR